MSRTIHRFVRISICALFVLCAMITAHAQFRAGVQGTISDSNGALVPDAKVILKDLETGKVQETNSSNEGFYRISGLAPGKYELTVEKAGYKKSLAENVTINAEIVQGVDVILEPGEISEQVNVAVTQQLETETDRKSVV